LLIPWPAQDCDAADDFALDFGDHVPRRRLVIAREMCEFARQTLSEDRVTKVDQLVGACRSDDDGFVEHFIL
jgi:hypothetical protein